MERKRENTFVDESLGFPVVLEDVPMKKIRGEWILDIPLNEYQQVVIWILAHADFAFTGRHVRFVRHWMEMTQKDFGDMLGVSHVAVSKWEDKGSQPTSMARATEVQLRLEMLLSLPEAVWERLSGPDGRLTQRQSLSRLLEDLKAFDTPSDRGVDAERLTVRGEELQGSGRLRLGH
jgi:DNA-binding XRE family transcriptional regulator